MTPIIRDRKIMFTSEGGSVAPMTRAAAEEMLADYKSRLPKIKSEKDRATIREAIATYERGIELAKANGL